MTTLEPIKATSYTPEAFIPWTAWVEVERHLDSRGVCAGVGGARGSGKTWLLRHAVARTTDRDGVGVYFPSPSAYDSQTFLAGICLALATAVEVKLRPPRLLATAILEGANKRLVQAAIVVATVLLVAVLTAGMNIERRVLYSALAAFVAWSYVALLGSFRQRQLDRNPGRELYAKSLALQRWIQFASTRTSASELGLQAGQGLIATGRVSEELALSERPVTELALVREFRGLAEGLSDLHIPLTIVIDELDKIGSVDDVRLLLRSVKGVLDPPGAVLLVSVSDEAVTHLGLSGLRGRDEITSSFASMIEVPPLTREQMKSLLEKAAPGIRSDATDAIWVVSAANQREGVRLLDKSLGRSRDLTADLCIDTSSTLEAAEMLNALAVDTRIGESARLGAYKILRAWQQCGTGSVEKVLALWSPPWATPADWPEAVAEEWRRFVCREALRLAARTAINAGDRAGLDALAEAFNFSQHSATIAREALADPPVREIEESHEVAGGRWRTRMARLLE